MLGSDQEAGPDEERLSAEELHTTVAAIAPLRAEFAGCISDGAGGTVMQGCGSGVIIALERRDIDLAARRRKDLDTLDHVGGAQ